MDKLLPQHPDVTWEEVGGDPKLVVHTRERIFPYHLRGLELKDILMILERHGL